jgi:LDH2 family malate/lactate/ureidoglycolate dehydrogenase
VVLDIATSVVSYGTVKAHKLQHRPMPEGWMIDARDGSPLTDPARSGEGLLLPLGGYKGSGLAIVLGLLAGPLNGAAFGRDVIDFNADQESLTNTGHFILALDIARFTPLDAFKAEVDRHIRDLRATRPLPGFDAVRVPGEQRRKRRQERARDGVPLVAELVAQLDGLAGELGVATIRDRSVGKAAVGGVPAI